MNRREHLLTILAEECAEVAQRASKALRFGCDEVQPGQALTNAERIVSEFLDLCAAMEMLRRDGAIPQTKQSAEVEAHIYAKIDKVEKFLELSRREGTLTDGDRVKFANQTDSRLDGKTFTVGK